MSNPIVAVQCTKCTMRCEDERYFAITNLTPCNLNNCDGRMEFQFQDQLDEIKNSWSKLFEREQQQEKFITEEEFYATEECITEDGKHSVVDGHCWNCCACDTCISRLEEKEEEDKTCHYCDYSITKEEFDRGKGRIMFNDSVMGPDHYRCGVCDDRVSDPQGMFPDEEEEEDCCVWCFPCSDEEFNQFQDQKCKNCLEEEEELK